VKGATANIYKKLFLIEIKFVQFA